MDTINFILSVIGLALGVAALALVFAIEKARRPQLSVEPGERYWTQPPFAHVAIINRRPSGILGRRFSGVTVTNCRASIEFLRDGVSVLGPIDGRWSGAPEPRDPHDLPNSFRWDLAATGVPEQIAIARTEGGQAHAFSAESYFCDWQRPGWELEPGTYDVVVRLTSTEADTTATVRLVVSANGGLHVGEAAS